MLGDLKGAPRLGLRGQYWCGPAALAYIADIDFPLAEEQIAEVYAKRTGKAWRAVCNLCDITHAAARFHGLYPKKHYYERRRSILNWRRRFEFPGSHDRVLVRVGGHFLAADPESIADNRLKTGVTWDQLRGLYIARSRVTHAVAFYYDRNDADYFF
jgi:hypothetical protein